jgi:Transposase DDE domain
MGWFYGFKLHLIVNERGELTSFIVTPGNIPDNNIKTVTKLAKRMHGKLFGGRGYISKDLFATLRSQGTQLITGVKKNMKNKLLPLMDKIMFRGRGIIETINDQLKNQEQIEHARHRSPVNFGVNLFSGLIAYQLQPKKPGLNFTSTEQRLLTQPLLLPA